LTIIFTTIEDEYILNTSVETYSRDPRDTLEPEFFIWWWWWWSQSKMKFLMVLGLSMA